MSASTSEPTPDVMASEIEDVNESWFDTVVEYWPRVAAPAVTLVMAVSMALAMVLEVGEEVAELMVKPEDAVRS